MKTWRIPFLCLTIIAALLLNGCGGGNGAVSTVSGVAASGSPISGTARLKDSSVPARELSASIGIDGSFSFDVTGLTPPFLLKAAGTVGGNACTYYSFATAAGTANINPLAHLAVVEAAGQDDLAPLYAAPDRTTMQGVAAALPDALARLRAALGPTLAKFGAASVDFVSTPYIANHRGLDLLLDTVSITAANGLVTVTDRMTGTTTSIPRGDFLSAPNDIVPHFPSRNPGGIMIFPTAAGAPLHGRIDFIATVVGTSAQGVTWRVEEADGGTVSDSGVYTAPGIPGTYHVTAISTSDPSKRVTAPVTVRNVGYLTLVETGPGTLRLHAVGVTDITGIDIRISYGSTRLTSPAVTKGELAGGAVMLADTMTEPGVIRIAMVTTEPISGSGTLADISFASGYESGGAVLLYTTLFDSSFVSYRLIPLGHILSGYPPVLPLPLAEW
jgi:hypothetical protein